jgi:hypothetical protein
MEAMMTDTYVNDLQVENAKLRNALAMLIHLHDEHKTASIAELAKISGEHVEACWASARLAL